MFRAPSSKVLARALTRATGARAVWCAVTLAALISLAPSLSARPPSQCHLGKQSEYVSVSDGTLSDETRKEVRLRVLIDALDDADIVFRGRLVSRRFLSDIYETYVPLILEVYDRATVLKGTMPSTATDGKVFLIREKLCDGGCRTGALPEVTDGAGQRERVVLALNNTLENPAEGKDRWSNQVVYRGRIDALHGPCDPYLINDSAAAELMASPAEMDRLRRTYPPRTAEDKRRDEQIIINKFMRRQ
jgi:hypothetical protein